MNNLVGKNIKVILLDWDDNLVDTFGAKSKGHKYIANTYYGIRLTDDDIKKHWGIPHKSLISILYDTYDHELAMKRVLKHHAEFPKTAYPETAEVLKTLKDNGYFVGVVTATNRISLDYDIESMKLTGLFDYTQTEEDTDYHKPNPKVFDPAIEWLKTHDVQLNEVLYLGDGLHDMKAALGAGFQFIGTARGFVSVKQFNEQGTQAINHIGELIQES